MSLVIPEWGNTRTYTRQSRKSEKIPCVCAIFIWLDHSKINHLFSRAKCLHFFYFDILKIHNSIHWAIGCGIIFPYVSIRKWIHRILFIYILNFHACMGSLFRWFLSHFHSFLHSYPVQWNWIFVNLMQRYVFVVWILLFTVFIEAVVWSVHLLYSKGNKTCDCHFVLVKQQINISIGILCKSSSI